MAIHASSTIAPTVQPGLSHGGGTVPCRVLTTDELLDEIRRTVEGREACQGDTPTLLPGDRNCPDEIRLVAEAQSLHFRRELHQALDYGFVLLDALDLPPLALDVIDDAIATLDALDAPDEDLEPWLACYQDLAFYPLDGENDDEYLEDDGTAEPSLGAPENHPGRWSIDMAGRYFAGSRYHPLGDQTNWNAGTNDDTEDDGDDREPEAGYCLPEGDDERDGDGSACGETGEYSLGWTAKVDQVHLGQCQDDTETTALERHGKGFIRSGPDDAEDDDREAVNEDGSDWGEAQTPWWDRIGYPEMEAAHA